MRCLQLQRKLPKARPDSYTCARQCPRICVRLVGWNRPGNRLGCRARWRTHLLPVSAFLAPELRRYAWLRLEQTCRQLAVFHLVFLIRSGIECRDMNSPHAFNGASSVQGIDVALGTSRNQKQQCRRQRKKPLSHKSPPILRQGPRWHGATISECFRIGVANVACEKVTTGFG